MEWGNCHFLKTILDRGLIFCCGSTLEKWPNVLHFRQIGILVDWKILPSGGSMKYELLDMLDNRNVDSIAKMEFANLKEK